MRKKTIVIAMLAFGLLATAGAGAADAGLAATEDADVDEDAAEDEDSPCEMHTHFGSWKGIHYRYPHPHCL